MREEDGYAGIYMEAAGKPAVGKKSGDADPDGGVRLPSTGRTHQPGLYDGVRGGHRVLFRYAA